MSAGPIRLFLAGCNGRMGHVVERLVSESGDLRISAGCDANLPRNPAYPVFSDMTLCDVDYDVLVDFSHPSVFPSMIALSHRTGKPAVVCVTGLTGEQLSELHDFSRDHPVFQSPNMSLGVNLLTHLVEKAAEVLYPDFDIEIVEAHHNQKLDAPSGTALLIADAAKRVRDRQAERDGGPECGYVYDRHDVRRKRSPGEIGIHSIRGGSIVGDHEVIFAGQDEVVRLSHSIASREVFGRGALAAARYMAGKGPGFYTMKDLIGG